MIPHDHTVGVRRRLVRIAVSGVVGLLLAVAGAVVTILVVRVGDGQAPSGLVWAAWVGVAAVAALSLATLAVCAVAWRRYLRRRVSLDAKAAGSYAEMWAQLATRRADEP